MRWSSSARLDDYFTVKALRREIALVDKDSKLSKKPSHQRNEELATTLTKEVEGLNQTLRTFSFFSTSSSDMKGRIEIMKRIREELGDVFLYSLRIANELEIDVSRSVHEKIGQALKDYETPEKFVINRGV